MSIDLFKKVVGDYVAIGGGAITISPIVGDCLVDHYLLVKLRILSSYNEIRDVGFHTNIIALDKFNDDQVIEILEIVDWLCCSVGPNHEVYREMFGVDRFESVVRNLERILSLMNYVRNKPIVGLSGRAWAGTFQIDERIDRLSAALMEWKLDWSVGYCDWGGALPELPRNTPVTRASGQEPRPFPCMMPLNSAVVFWDGRVGLCGCADSDALLKIGDVNQEKLGEILSGKKRQQYLYSFAKGTLNRYCRKCTFYEPLNEGFIAEWVDGTNPYMWRNRVPGG